MLVTCPVSNVAVTNNGMYSGSLDPGQYSLEGTANGFMTFRRDITVSSGASEDVRILMAPVMQTGQLRIVLTWNRRISDLDLHMITPGGCEVGWQNRQCRSATADASLDVDDTDGEGPETISINRLAPGTYSVYVHRYTSGDFLSSDATVRIFFPSGNVRTYNIATSGTVQDGK